ncbi:hypothetical protein NDU88_006464 [Pleurodeles waltl]|uniref:Secreted protein n=1 Tax=Pleurodeles waltl TaxID=8319 RepID=A0AAV7VR23_PLEWA|nr:hypothetical protein NDU88_006464 [Pleurodeles waltl]
MQARIVGAALLGLLHALVRVFSFFVARAALLGSCSDATLKHTCGLHIESLAPRSFLVARAALLGSCSDATLKRACSHQRAESVEGLAPRAGKGEGKGKITIYGETG